MKNFMRQYGPYLAFGVALTATLGSLYYSEVAGFLPCKLCWYQRILMYPLVIVTLVGIFLQDEFLPNYVLPFSISGILLSGYHYLVQVGVLAQPISCADSVPCGSRYVNYLGFITIPFMALVAFILITIFLGLMKLAAAEEDE
ncbi:MAG: disulfide bond formation protein B [Chloroflexi bacterium]|nr:MAG: disulfide bond formation protein B [Chloroflexota bacterium]